MFTPDHVKPRPFTFRYSQGSATYTNATPERSTFRRRSRVVSEPVACSKCHIVHALLQRECE